MKTKDYIGIKNGLELVKAVRTAWGDRDNYPHTYTIHPGFIPAIYEHFSIYEVLAELAVHTVLKELETNGG